MEYLYVNRMKRVGKWQDKKRVCWFCGSNKSVKYDISIETGNGEETVQCCNWCVWNYYICGKPIPCE